MGFEPDEEKEKGFEEFKKITEKPYRKSIQQDYDELERLQDAEMRISEQRMRKEDEIIRRQVWDELF